MGQGQYKRYRDNGDIKGKQCRLGQCPDYKVHVCKAEQGKFWIEVENGKSLN